MIRRGPFWVVKKASFKGLQIEVGFGRNFKWLLSHLSLVERSGTLTIRREVLVEDGLCEAARVRLRGIHPSALETSWRVLSVAS